MNYMQNHIPKSSVKRPGIPMNASFLTVHSTANPKSTAGNERDWLTNPQNDTSTGWHICVDEYRAIEAIPLNEVAYHAGNAKGNTSSLGIELCESGDRQKVIENAADLIAGMLFEREWGIDRLKRHYDWSGKNCPQIMNLSGDWQCWEDFKTLVAVKLAERYNEETGETEVRYNSIDKVPEYGRATIEKLVDKGILQGDSVGLNLSDDMIRIFVVLDRAGVFGE